MEKQSSKSIFSRPYFDRCDLGPESKRSSIKKKKMIRASARQSNSILRVFLYGGRTSEKHLKFPYRGVPIMFVIIFNFFVAT